MKNPRGNLLIILIAIVMLFVVAVSIVPGGILDVTDIKDYSDTAKFFAGDYSAKHRSAHSILYGIMLSPYVKIAHSFFLIKLSSAFFLSLLILSIYYMSGKNRKALLLFIFSPLVWYLTPWLGPMPLASLLLLWGYYFAKKYDSEEKIKYLIYSGLLVGLSSAFWDTVLYVSAFFLVAFFYDKKFYSSFIFLPAMFVGILPRLAVDYFAYGFPFYSIVKHASAVVVFTLFGGIYEGEFRTSFLFSIILFALFIPVFSYLIYKKENFAKYKKEVIFITLYMLFIISNPQPRLLFFILPILTIMFGEILSKKQVRIQLIIYIILMFLVLTPYFLQTKYYINERRFDEIVFNYDTVEFTERVDRLILKDLDDIYADTKGSIFVVGNKNDDYRQLAHLYWGEDIEEFVSIEDYNLSINNESVIVEQKICSDSNFKVRREICLGMGLFKSSNDETDYESIEYAIGLDNYVELEGFKPVKKYDFLYLSRRS